MTDWQKEILDAKEIIKGLMFSDGSYFKCNTSNRYFYEFSNCSEDIIQIMSFYLNELGISHIINKRKFLQAKAKSLKISINIRQKDAVEKLHSIIGDKNDIK